MIRTKLVGWGGAVALSCLVLAGCGGAANSAGPSGTPSTNASSGAPVQTAAPASAQGGSTADACALVTEQDATTALGSDPGPGTARSANSASQCTYGSVGGRGTELIAALAPGGRTYFDDAKTKIEASYQQQGGTVQDVTGVGDAAFVVAVANGGAFVVLKGDAVASISLISRTPLNATADTLTTLGRTAGGRM